MMGATMKRPIIITKTYTPGKSHGKMRQITVDGIPATEVTFEGEIDTHMTFEVADRIDTLIERALASNDLPHQRISYTASDPGVPVDPRPWHKRFPACRRQPSVPAEVS